MTPEELVAEAEAGGPDVDDDSEPAPAAPAAKPAEDLILQKAIEIARKKA